MSTPAAESRRDGLETFAGLMSSVAIFIAVIGITNLDLSIEGNHLQFKPVRIEVAAIVLALIAAGIGGRHRRLAAIAVAVCAASWLLAMIVAVVTTRPLF